MKALPLLPRGRMERRVQREKQRGRDGRERGGKIQVHHFENQWFTYMYISTVQSSTCINY